MIFYFIKKDSITLDTFDLSFRRYNHVMREKSSTKSRKYLKSLIEDTWLGLQTSEWTNSKAKLRLLIQLWKVARWCLPTSQDSQPKEKIEDSIRIIDHIFCTEEWPKRQCYSKTKSGWPATKPVGVTRSSKYYMHPRSCSKPISFPVDRSWNT